MVTRYVQRHLTWIDLVSPTPGEVRALMDEFEIDPAFANELLTSSYKPKVERRGDMIYVILHFPLLRGMGKQPEEEIDFLIGKNFLITARYTASDPLHSFAKAFEVNAVLGHNATATHGGHIFVAMARNLYQALANDCEVIDHHLQEIEERIFRGDEKNMVVRLSETGRMIHDFRQRLLPHKEMLNSLEPQATRMFGQEFLYYVRTIEGDYERVRAILENLREALVELRETNNSLLSTKQNEVMKTLTVIAFVTLPLELIAGVLTMPTRDTPLVGLPGAFYIVLSIMALLATSFFVYFRYKDWI